MDPMRSLALGVAALILLAGTVQGVQVKSLQQVTQGGINFGPAWSPDGSRIAFFGNRPGCQGLCAVERDGSGLRQLVSISEGACCLSWSPEGDRLLFYVEGLEVGSPGNIWLLSLPERSVRVLAAGTHSSWSPDGRRVVFACPPQAAGSGGTGLCILPLEPPVRERAAVYDTLLQPLKPGESAGNPAWSPDGKSIAYLWQTPGSTPRLRLVSPEGTPIRDLAETPATIGALRWSPDGRLLAFEDRSPGARGRIFVLDLNAAPQGAALANQADTTTPLLSEMYPPPAGLLSVDGLSWSPRGNQMALAIAYNESGLNIHIADLDLPALPGPATGPSPTPRQPGFTGMGMAAAMGVALLWWRRREG